MNWQIELDTEDHETLATKEISEAFDEWGFACGAERAYAGAPSNFTAIGSQPAYREALIYTLLEVASAISLAHGGESDLLASVDSRFSCSCSKTAYELVEKRLPLLKGSWTDTAVPPCFWGLQIGQLSRSTAWPSNLLINRSAGLKSSLVY